MECEYCQNERSRVPLCENTNWEHGFVKNTITLGQTVDAIFAETLTDNGLKYSCGVKIKYCPMCGRKF